MRKFSLLCLVGFLAACSTPQGTPLYRDIGIRLSGQLIGTLLLRNKCYVAKPAVGTEIILVLPEGTIFEKARIKLPPQNGGTPASLGEQIKLTGGFIEITAQESDPYRSSPCKGDAFIVNDLETDHVQQ